MPTPVGVNSSVLHCGCLRETTCIVFTVSMHPRTFSASQMSLAALLPTKPRGYKIPVMIYIPMPRNNSTYLATFYGATTKILLVSFGKYPCGGPLAWKSWKCARMLPAPTPQPTHPRIIRVPWLGDARMCIIDLEKKLRGKNCCSG